MSESRLIRQLLRACIHWDIFVPEVVQFCTLNMRYYEPWEKDHAEKRVCDEETYIIE